MREVRQMWRRRSESPRKNSEYQSDRFCWRDFRTNLNARIHYVILNVVKNLFVMYDKKILRVARQNV